MDDFQKYLDAALKQVNLENIKPKQVYSDYDLSAELSQLIVNTRNDNGMTQSDLARVSGVSQSNISKMENGNYIPSLTILKRIANGLGKRLIIDLIDREDINDGYPF